jgi:hypothetical protein
MSEEAYWRTRPGGLSSVACSFPGEPSFMQRVGYTNLDFFIKVMKDPGSDLTAYPIPKDIRGTDTILGYYWANQFAFAGGSKGGVDGYIGIQTIGDIWTFDPANRNVPARNRFLKHGRMAIYSIFGGLDARPGPTNSHCAPFGHEGSGWSCKVEYPWRSGVTYCLQVWELSNDGKPTERAWWRGAILDTAANQQTIIGDIRVPPTWSRLRKDASWFTEYYSATVKQAIGDEDDGKPNPRACQYMPKAEVVIFPPHANNGTVSVTAMTARSYGKCAGVSSFALLRGNAAIPCGARLTPPEAIVHRTGTIDRGTAQATRGR